jgi:membrane protease YdiL (CAAX protease family)
VSPGQQHERSAQATLPPRGILYRMLGFEAALGLLAVGLAWLFGICLRAGLGGDWFTAIAWGLLATLPMLAMMAWFEISRQRWVVEIRAFVEEKLIPLFDGISAGGIFLIALFAGVFEELLFRGTIQGGLESAWGLWPALIVASLLFGLAHAMTPAYFIITALMGLYLGGLYAWTDQLLVPIVAHFLYDWAVFAWLLRKRRSPA